MYQVLIKAFVLPVLPRSHCRCRRALLKVPNIVRGEGGSGSGVS